jgi:1-acyl-sn-glycerol-3-phosphate acyltransferase
VRMAAGPPVDLSGYAGQRLGASTLRAATADIMADITALLAGLRQETPPAVPYDPTARPGNPPGPDQWPPSTRPLREDRNVSSRRMSVA